MLDQLKEKLMDDMDYNGQILDLISIIEDLWLQVGPYNCNPYLSLDFMHKLRTIMNFDDGE